MPTANTSTRWCTWTWPTRRAAASNSCAGSHKLGKLEHIRGPEVEPHLPTHQYSIRDAVSVPANPGDVVFFSIYTIHGSALNRSGRWRRLVRVGLRDPRNPQTDGVATGRPGIMVKGVRPKVEGADINVYKNWSVARCSPARPAEGTSARRGRRRALSSHGKHGCQRLEDVDHLVTDEVVAEYWERGYWVGPKLFSDDQVQRLREAHDRLWSGKHDYPVPSMYGWTARDLSKPDLRQQVDAFYLNAEMRKAILSPLIGKIAARLMRADSVRLWHDQALFKPGTGGKEVTIAGNVGWHQDYGFWQCCSNDNMCSAWVALQDTDLTNGAMQMVVGSHKWGLIEGSNNDKKEMEKWADHYARLAGVEWS